MRLKTALTLFGFTLCIGLAALAVSLRNGLSLGFVTPYLESRASALLGRRLSFKEAPRIQIKSGLHIAASKVSLANADWADADELLQLDSLTAHIDLSTLFDDQLILETLLVDGLQLKLQKSVDGLSNLPHVDSDTAEDNEDDRQQHPLPVLIRHIELSNVQIDRTNDETEQSVSLTIDKLYQDAVSEKSLKYRGSGSLQGKPWALSINSSSFKNLRLGLNLSADFSASLGGLKLQGDYRIPDLRELQNLTLNAELAGPVPDRIAALSPLLEANEAASIALSVIDINPGLHVDLRVALQQVDAMLTGDIDDPRSSDGLDLDLQLKAASLARLAQALGLGETPHVPLTIDGRLLRKDTRIELRDAVLAAGDHRMQADAVLPEFPGTDGAKVSFRATGPDFSLYQKLLKRRVNLETPYALNAEIVNSISEGDTVTGDLRIGSHKLKVSGVLNNFPSYAGSELDLEFESPSLKVIAANADIALPVDTPISIATALSVSQDAVVSINAATITAYDATSQIRGQFDSYPDFDNADLQFQSKGASLSVLAERFGIQGLGDQPLLVSAKLQGSPQEVEVNNLRLDTAGLQALSSGGALRYAHSEVTSDLRLSVTLTDMDTLLGVYAPMYVPRETFSFDLLPQLSPSLLTVGLDNLTGPGISGNARLELTSDFKLNEKTLLTANLNLDDLSQLLPDIGEYTPPRDPLVLRLVTRPSTDATQIEAQLADTNSELLSAVIRLPADTQAQAIDVSLSGAGNDLRQFGTHERMPDQQIPYALDLVATVLADTVSAQVRSLRLGDSHVQGVAQWDGADRSLTAELQVPQADLSAWLPKDKATNRKAGPVSSDGRLIPDLTLPLNLLHAYRLDLALETGDLGLADPRFKTQSLIEKSSLRLQSGGGKGRLQVEKLLGSRGSYTADVSIVDTQEPARISTEFTVSDLPLGIVAAGTGYHSLPTYDLDARLDAQGPNLRTLAATLNGDLLVTGGAGTLQKMKLSAATESFVAQVFRTLLPMLATGQTNMEVECSVLAARASDGILRLDPGFVFRSAQIELLAQGQVNLRNEKLGIGFSNRARKGLGISAASLINPYVEITGTLSKPALGLNVASSAITGGAAVATGGLSLLAKPLYDRFVRQGNPCDTALQLWKDTAN